MIQPMLSARRSGRALLAALAGVALASCSASDDLLPPSRRAETLQIVSRNPQPGVAGQPLPESVRLRVVDASGAGVRGVNVSFDVTAGGGTISPGSDNTNENGFVDVTWTLGSTGEQSAVAHIIGADGVRLNARLVPVPAPAAPMLGMLRDYIGLSIDRMEEGLPRNPQAASYMEAKIALLRTPGLGGDIVDGHRYAQGSVASRFGATLPVTAVFPVESLRGEAARAIDVPESAIPVLEGFLDAPYPTPAVRIWYGFWVGSAGGGGTVHAEDRTTYQTRAPFLPYDPMIVHELAHTYMGHESMNQFLELYGYNVPATNTTDATRWTWTRGWVPGRDANEGIHAILDIYQLIGHDAFATAYRALLAVRPPFGQVLSAEAQQTFTNAAPAAARTQVAAKLAKVGF